MTMHKGNGILALGSLDGKGKRGVEYAQHHLGGVFFLNMTLSFLINPFTISSPRAIKKYIQAQGREPI